MNIFPRIFLLVKQQTIPALLTAASLSILSTPLHAEPGISTSSIRLAGVMDLDGRSKGLGQGMKTGLEKAMEGETVHGRRIDFMFLDDSYTPNKTVVAVNKLIKRDPFLFIGNVGTPTAKVSLPILAKHRIPAFGFFTGAGILRPGIGDIINFRASYVQETARVINNAIAAGVQTNQVCAYVQNDAYGMSGVTGVIRALRDRPGAGKAVAALEQIRDMEGENPARNGLGPVGVYQRNTFVAREGYLSLKKWEKANNTKCRLVVTVGAYTSISNFVAYSRVKGENWVTSAVSFTGADNFANELLSHKINDRVIMTQVTPLLNSSLPIVTEAREKLGNQFGYVTLEGFIAGKLFLHLAREMGEFPSRKNLLQTVSGSSFDLGGLTIDFRNDNQASDLVTETYLTETGWKPMGRDQWVRWLY